MHQPRRPVPVPPSNRLRENISSPSSSEEEVEEVDREGVSNQIAGNNYQPKRKNNEVDNSNGSDSDEVFHPAQQDFPSVGIIETDKELEERPPRNFKIRNRRVSYGKIPVPPMQVTVEDIQNAARQTRKPVDPRRSSVSLDVFKNFRDPHDKKNIPAHDKTVYVEGPDGKFREIKRGHFWNNKQMNSPIKQDTNKHEKESVIPFLLKAPGQAYRTQKAFNQTASIVQGFLAGVSVMLAIFSFNLEAEVLLSGYRLISLPINAAFMVAFTISFVSAIDRTGIYKVEHFTSRTRLAATVSNNGLFAFIVWFVGLVSTLLCIQLESQLTFAPTKVPSHHLVYQWRIFNVFRAVTAALGFLLLAFRPDSDTMAKELKKAIFEQLEVVTSDPDTRQIIITAMKI